MNPRLLLDTHVLICALGAPGRLPLEVRQDISRSDVFVSAATLWEIAVRFSAGTLDLDPALVLREAERSGFYLLNVSGLHAARSADFNATGGQDPFDRLLIAQAMCEGMTLLTNDAALARYAPTVRLIDQA